MHIRRMHSENQWKGRTKGFFSLTSTGLNGMFTFFSFPVCPGWNKNMKDTLPLYKKYLNLYLINSFGKEVLKCTSFKTGIKVLNLQTTVKQQ